MLKATTAVPPTQCLVSSLNEQKRREQAYKDETMKMSSVGTELALVYQVSQEKASGRKRAVEVVLVRTNKEKREEEEKKKVSPHHAYQLVLVDTCVPYSRSACKAS